MDLSDYLKHFEEGPLEGEENNLCHTTIEKPRHRTLCEGNLGILRKDMPQNSGYPQSGSVADRLKDMGVLVPNANGGVDVNFLFLKLLKNLHLAPGKPELVYAGSLKPTQSEIVGPKVWELVNALHKNPDWQKDLIQQCYDSKLTSSTSGLTGPLLISEDDMVLDGHHRLVAAMAATQPSGSALVCIRRIPLNMHELIDIANKFTKAIGIQQEKGL